MKNLGCLFDKHVTEPPRVQLVLFVIISSTPDHQNPTPADTRRVPCRSMLSCAESPRLLQWSIRWSEQWTDQPTPTSTNLCRSPYSRCQTARSYQTDFAIAALAADQDESHFQELYLYVYDHARLISPDYIICAIARNAPTRALRSASDATLLAVIVPRRMVGRGRFAVASPTMFAKQLAKVYEIN